MRRSIKYTGLALLAAVSGLAGVASAAPTYNVTDLGALGGPTSKGFALDKKGDTVGQGDTSTGYHHAFYNNGSGIQDLMTLGGNYSAAYGINQGGNIVGYAAVSTGYDHAFLYSGSSLRDLGTLGGSQSTAMGINDSNVIVGRATDSGGQFHAFYYKAGQKTEIATGNTFYSNANAINRNGIVVGTWTPSSGVQNAFSYDISTNTFSDLGTLKSQTYAEAFAVNRTGEIVGGSGTGGTIYAFKYQGGTMVRLPTLSGPQSYAYGINDSGSIVGFSENSSNANRAFIYTKGTLTDLNTLIDPASGWTLTIAHAINNAGEIVGEGVLNGATRGFLLTTVTADMPPASPAEELDDSDSVGN